MNAKHTPGPWTLIERLIDGEQCRFDPLNPCWNNRPNDVAGIHWGGADACEICAARAALAIYRGMRDENIPRLIRELEGDVTPRALHRLLPAAAKALRLIAKERDALAKARGE